jgi:hypothetical protein
MPANRGREGALFFGDYPFDKPKGEATIGPNSLWSLWDMLRIRALRFAGTMTIVGRLQQFSELYSVEIGDISQKEGLKETLVKFCDLLKASVEELGLKFSLMHVERISEDIKDHARYTKDTERLIHELQGRIQDELEDTVLLLLSAKYGAIWESGAKAFGDATAAKFPTLTEDIAESAKCLATGRYTACVFHLMRIMESLVQQLGTKLGISIIDHKNWEKNWHNILEEVDKAVKLLPKSAETVRINEASAHLHAVKLAWRNEVMHPKETYTEEQANEVFSHVKAFATDMVGVLK